MGEKRNQNKKFFESFEQDNIINKSKIGKGTIYSYCMKSFYNSTIEDMKKNIYYYLDEEPTVKPYRN
jgi:hypothetical protein